MSGARLRRHDPAPPVRAVHLGLGSFFRAHQAWYTDLAGAATGDAWGIAAFAGRRAGLADALRAQDGLYTLLTRDPTGDQAHVVRALASAGSPADHDLWLALLADPGVAIVTTTVTEAGYRLRPDGDLDLDDAEVAADAAALRRDGDAAVGTAPGRLVAGLAARRRRDAGPITLVPCDNLPENGRALRSALVGLADAVDPSLASWLEQAVDVATTMVDRITPAPTADDRATALRLTGHDDPCAVATEPFSEWVIGGRFRGGRPSWEAAGAVLTDDVEPFEERKLWLLNGGHVLLAYVGSLRGHQTVSAAVQDPVCRQLLEAWWDLCAPHLRFTSEEVSDYRAALLARFDNPRIVHRLEQIAVDGSQKLPVRILPVLRRERAAGRLPLVAAGVLAAWVLHLRGRSVPVSDVRGADFRALALRSATDAPRAVLAELAPDLADDEELVAALVDQVAQLAGDS